MMLLPKVEEIRKRRLEMNLSMVKLSKKANLSGASILRIENRLTEKVHPLRAREIAKALNCKVEDIFEEVKKGA